MTKIAEKWSDYSFREKVAIILGVVILAIQTFRYATNGLSENVGIEIFAFAAGFLLLFAPKTIVSIIKKKKGVDDAS